MKKSLKDAEGGKTRSKNVALRNYHQTNKSTDSY